MRLPSPALVVAGLALFVALGGTVYAAKKARIDGKAVKVKSLPGNRLKLRSIPANRLKPGVLTGALGGQSGPITGAEIDELTLGQVPEAAHAISAENVNGHGAGCLPGTQQFAGACWQSFSSETAVSAPAAANACAVQGGALPEALQLAAFSQQPGVVLDSGTEWSSDIPVFTDEDIFAVVTVSAGGNFDFSSQTSAHKYRCVIPLLR
jgi:hypothetical protein